MRALLLLTCLTLPLHAAAECREIDRLPALIDAPGDYCLTDSHSVNMPYGVAIEVASGDVTIDLSGNTLRNTHGNRTTAFGIRALDQRNVTVTGGSVAGFHTGVLLGSSSHGCRADITGPYRVTGMTIAQAHRNGIAVEGCQVLIEGNQVADIGKTFRDTGLGISAAGTQLSVVNNDVQGVVGDSQTSIGIWLVSGTGIAQGNRIQAAPNGLVMPIGGLVPYRENTTIEIYRYAYEGGQDAGGNF